MERDRVMMRVNDANFGKKMRFGKLMVGDKKGKEAEGREKRGGGGAPFTGGGGNDGLAMNRDFYQRDVL